MEKQHVAGLRPWLPWPLSRSRWWTEPVPAERFAALRIGLAAALLFDLLTTYLPQLHAFFGPGSMAGPGVFGQWLGPPHWRWSLLEDATEPRWLEGAAAAWALATVFLLLGVCTRLSALIVWMLSTSFANLNPNIDNAGDTVRGILLLYLMLTPCGAVWSVDAWLRRRGDGRTFIYPWALRLIFIQMVLIYFCNGLYKLAGEDWRQGRSLYYVLGDLTLARWSYAAVPIPYALTQLLSWSVLVWEVSFPLLVCWGRTRVIALWFGVAFHAGIGVSLELGSFAPYMLCMYLPLVPWERYGSRSRPIAPL